MNKKNILITKNDREKLLQLIEDIEKHVQCDNEKKALLFNLKVKLNCTSIVSPQDIPPTYVTMNSKFQYLNIGSGKISTYSLVFPEEASIDQNKISIISPVGIAVLGQSVGDLVECKLPFGVAYLKVLHIIYQPEAMGIYTI